MRMMRKEQTAGRVVSIPEGMILAEGRRAIDGYTEEQLRRLARQWSTFTPPFDRTPALGNRDALFRYGRTATWGVGVFAIWQIGF